MGNPPRPDRGRASGRGEAAALAPILARALELGRGPPGLAAWARRMIDHEPAGRPRSVLLRRLAETVRAFTTRRAAADTRDGRADPAVTLRG